MRISDLVESIMEVAINTYTNYRNKKIEFQNCRSVRGAIGTALLREQSTYADYYLRSILRYIVLYVE